METMTAPSGFIQREAERQRELDQARRSQEEAPALAWPPGRLSG